MGEVSDEGIKVSISASELVSSVKDEFPLLEIHGIDIRSVDSSILVSILGNCLMLVSSIWQHGVFMIDG
jgi:hypothetical protein